MADDVERLARLTYADASSDTQNIHAMEQFIKATCDNDLRGRAAESAYELAGSTEVGNGA